MTDLNSTSIPISLSALVMTSELVSSRDDVSNSLPTARIAARRIGRRAHASEPGNTTISSAHREIAVDPRHRVVEHDAGPAVEMFEPAGGIRFDDVEQRGTAESRRRRRSA